MLLKVKPIKDEKLLKNTENKAVLNNDQKAYSEYINKRDLLNRVDSMEKDINTIKSSLDTLTDLVKKVLEK